MFCFPNKGHVYSTELFLQILSYSRVYVRIFEKRKGQVPLGLLLEKKNKTYKLKRSIDQVCYCFFFSNYRDIGKRTEDVLLVSFTFSSKMGQKYIITFSERKLPLNQKRHEIWINVKRVKWCQWIYTTM